MEDTPGSRTARGIVLIVFGSPARVRDEHAPPAPAARSARRPAPSRATRPSRTGSTTGSARRRFSRRSSLPSFEVQIIIEPFRHSDAIESPGLVKELREKLARRTIVNPDAAVPSAAAAPTAAEAAPPAAAAPAFLPGAGAGSRGASAPSRDVLDSGLRASLDQAPFVSRSGEAVFGDAVLWRDTGGARTLLWLSVPPAAAGSKRSFQGVVRKENGGDEVASFTDASGPSDAFSSAAPSDVFVRRSICPREPTRRPSR